MIAAKQGKAWHEAEAARLGSEIRQTMARLGSEHSSQDDVVKIGRLIDRRIEEAYSRGLRAALSSKPPKAGVVDG